MTAVLAPTAAPSFVLADPTAPAVRTRLVETIYIHLNRGDLDPALALMAPEVESWDTILTGERIRGRVPLGRHWRSVLGQLRVRIEPRGVRPSGARLVVDAVQMIGDSAGKPLAHQEMRHVFSFDAAGLVARLEAREPKGIAHR